MNHQQQIPKLGIIGLGDKGQKYLQASKKMETKGILKLWLTCDPNFTESQAKFHFQHFAEVLKQESLDFVLLDVPVMYRSNMIKQLLSCGVSVICLGSPANSQAELEQVNILTNEKSVSVISTQHRFFNKNWIDLKSVGNQSKLIRFNIVLNEKSNDVRWQEDQQSGVWMNLGYQALQITDWLFGDIATIKLRQVTSQFSLPREHTAVAKVTLKNGVMGTVLVSDTPPTKDLIRVKTRGGLFSLVDNNLWHVKGNKASLISTKGNQNEYQKALAYCLNMIKNKQSTFDSDYRILDSLLNAELLKSSLSKRKSNH